MPPHLHNALATLSHARTHSRDTHADTYTNVSAYYDERTTKVHYIAPKTDPYVRHWICLYITLNYTHRRGFFWNSLNFVEDSHRFTKTVSTEWRHKFHIILRSSLTSPRKLVTVWATLYFFFPLFLAVSFCFLFPLLDFLSLNVAIYIFFLRKRALISSSFAIAEPPTEISIGIYTLLSRPSNLWCECVRTLVTKASRSMFLYECIRGHEALLVNVSNHVVH